jgi:hypothetical protein
MKNLINFAITHATAKLTGTMKLKDKRFFVFEAAMALAAVVTVAVTYIALQETPKSLRDFVDFVIVSMSGILLHTVCGAITWAAAKNDKYLELSLTQVVYTSFLPIAIISLYVLFTILSGINPLEGLFMAFLFAWFIFVLPSGIAVMLCTGLYKIAAKRYVR